MRQERWEMINPEYASPMFCPSPPLSECSASPGRSSTASAMCPWTLLPTSSVPYKSGGGQPDSFRCITSMLNPSGQIYSLAAAVAGELLYAGSDSKTIKVWRLPDFEEHDRLKSGCGNVRALIVAGDKIVSAHGDNKIRVWRRSRSNPNAHRRMATLPTVNIFQNFIRPLLSDGSGKGGSSSSRGKHSDAVTCLAYDANDDLLYSASCDKTVKVWKLSESKCIETIEAHSEAVNAIVVRADGVVFTGSDDSRVKVWRRGWGQRKHDLITTLYMQRSSVKALALAYSGGLPVVYAGCSDGYIHHWENDQLSEWVYHYVGFLRGHLQSVLCLATVADLLLSGSADTTIRVWKREAGGRGMCCLAVMEGHRGPVKCIAASSHSNSSNVFIVYSGSLDGMLKVWLGCMESTVDSGLAATDHDHDVASTDDYFVLRKAEEDEEQGGG